jgi:SAM-dependent methyltransferase
VTTSEVLEHVPQESILQLLREWKRILRPGGLMSHTINLADHFSNFDKEISPVNFLRFRERTWAGLCSGLAYCNRLRECQYLQMFSDAGFSILNVESTLDRGAMESLSAIPVAREFEGMSPAQLAVTRSLIVAQAIV